MEQKVYHWNTRLETATIRLAIERMEAVARRNAAASIARFNEVNPARKVSSADELSPYLKLNTATVERDSRTWTFDTLEEFLDEYRIGGQHAFLSYVPDYSGTGWKHTEGHSLQIEQYTSYALVSVKSPTRADVLEVSRTFEEAAETGKLEAAAGETEAAAPEVRIFIGHGGASSEWSKLKNHLQDLHHYSVEAFESGSRAGHSIRDILENMLDNASIAFLVMTAEDELAAGEDGRPAAMRARQNVVHEAGLFQGRLGFSRGIVLLEKGTENLSNLDGLQYIEFSKGNIKEAFGDVLAVLKREFGP